MICSHILHGHFSSSVKGVTSLPQYSQTPWYIPPQSTARPGSLSGPQLSLSHGDETPKGLFVPPVRRGGPLPYRPARPSLHGSQTTLQRSDTAPVLLTWEATAASGQPSSQHGAGETGQRGLAEPVLPNRPLEPPRILGREVEPRRERAARTRRVEQARVSPAETEEGHLAAFGSGRQRQGGDGNRDVRLALGWKSQQRPRGTVTASLTVVSNPCNIWSGGGEAAENEVTYRNTPKTWM